MIDMLAPHTHYYDDNDDNKEAKEQETNNVSEK